MAAPTPPEKEPEHSGLRPLSPWGEGYCRWCKFVVGLDYSGLLVPHVRGAQLQNQKACDGSGTRPPKVIPYMSRKAAFKTVARKERCHECSREVPVLSDGRFAPHTVAYRVTTACKGGSSFPRPPERDHGNERG